MSVRAGLGAGLTALGHSLIGGLRLLLLQPVKPALGLRPAWHYWPLFGLQVLLSLAIERYWAGSWVGFSADGLQSDAFVALLLLAAAQLTALLLGKPVLLWSLAVWWMAASLWLGALWAFVEGWLWTRGWLDLTAGRVSLGGFLIWWWLALAHTLRQLAPERARAPRMLTALAAAALSALPVFALQLATYRQPSIPAALPEDAQRSWPLARSPERLLTEQPALLQAQLDRLLAQDPDRLDVYLLSFAGDGGERVFGNEVDYAQRLFDHRFGTAGRSLGLLNQPHSTEHRPLATLSNLRKALTGLGGILDPEQDLLVLFLTTHGSEDHQLYVDLLGLPLDQISPADLRQALDESGIRWKVVIVSACYSGGFLDALADPSTLVITAARADRSSFGCGPDADFTYFGRAFFINALNRTGDLLEAFRQAREEIAAREAEEEYTPSEPQIASHPDIEAVLERWRSGLQLGAPLPWVAPPAEASP